jgi:hypothetical protein
MALAVPAYPILRKAVLPAACEIAHQGYPFAPRHASGRAQQASPPRRSTRCVDDGDWFELGQLGAYGLGQLGAYGACLRTRFNGFDSVLTVVVAGPPVLATRGYD